LVIQPLPDLSFTLNSHREAFGTATYQGLARQYSLDWHWPDASVEIPAGEKKDGDQLASRFKPHSYQSA
jgi:hypothetical protein